MIRTRVYTTSEADFPLKYIADRKPYCHLVMAKPDFYKKSKTIIFNEFEKVVVSNSILIKEQWQELNDIYHWLTDKNYLNKVDEIEAKEGLTSFTTLAQKFFSWETNDGKRYYFLNDAISDSEKKEAIELRQFFQKNGQEEIVYDGKDFFAGNLDLVPLIGKKILFTGIYDLDEHPVYSYVTHIFQAPIIALELINPNYKHLSKCFLQVDDNTALYYSKAFSEESIAFLHTMFDRLIDLPEDEVDNFVMLTDLFTGPNGKIALMQMGNSLSKKILIKLGYKVIELDISEFNKFGYGIKHLRNQIY